jgi:hypothetical protein
VVREQTVKAVLSVIGKLSDRVVNGELLKFLARTANDEQPGIRTNTTICLGKIAKNLGESVSIILPVVICFDADIRLDSLQGSYCCLYEIYQGSLRTRPQCWSASIVCHNRLIYGRGLCWQDLASYLSGTFG